LSLVADGGAVARVGDDGGVSAAALIQVEE
jgi:hypothetical protein